MRVFHGSLTRIAGLESREWEAVPVARNEWLHCDYVVGEVTNVSTVPLEVVSGRQVEVLPGDRVVGALGVRAATLEVVGSWREVGEGEALELLTGAGLMGRATSTAPRFPELVSARYVGHVHSGDEILRMSDFAVAPTGRAFDVPVVLIVGTSMSAGKTTAARFVVRMLRARGLRVAASKLTGAGRYRDILSIQDAGADVVFDFVDAGLPSTVCPTEIYERVVGDLLSVIAAEEPDVLVVEAGASPLEPYNGEAAIELLGDSVRCRILAASDPYAVVGVQSGFGWDPDLVTGPAANTSAALDLLVRLTGLPAACVFDVAGQEVLEDVLERCLDL